MSGPLPGTSLRQRAGWWWAVAAWIALIMLCVSWELLIAPLRPGGSWLAIKALPLLIVLPALVRGGPYAMQIALFISMIYLFEGGARLFEPGPAAALAIVELALVAVFLAGAVVYLRPMKLAARSRKVGDERR
jgi:uncharacterized membrane protein